MGLVKVVPPVPLATSINPAFFNCDKSYLMITGFTWMLDARKSLVILYSPPNTSMHASMWTAIVNLLDICIKAPPKVFLFSVFL